MRLKKGFCARQMSDKILVLSLKQQKLKHWSGCAYLHMYTQTRAHSVHPRLFVFPFLFSKQYSASTCPLSVQANYKDMASPNLPVHSWHANLFKQRRGPRTLPLRHRCRFPTSGSVYAKTGSAGPDVVGSMTQSRRTERQNIHKPTVSSFTHAAKWEIPLTCFTTSTKHWLANVHPCVCVSLIVFCKKYSWSVLRLRS